LYTIVARVSVFPIDSLAAYSTPVSLFVPPTGYCRLAGAGCRIFCFFVFYRNFPSAFFAVWLILHIEEHAPGSNIHSLPDATWWFWVTVTTVGYGDHYPVTFAGRMLAGGVMLVGIAAFSAMTALLASRLNERWNETHPGAREREYRLLRQQIDRMEQSLIQLEQKHLEEAQPGNTASSEESQAQSTS
jgi:hypothetical protein